MKKKILIVQRELPFYRLPLFENLLQDKKNEFYLITGENDELSGDFKEIKSDKYFKINNKVLKVKGFEFWNQRGVISKIKEIKPDIIIFEGMISNITNWKIIRLKKKMGFKIIAWVCGYQKNKGKLKDFLLRNFFRKFDYFLAYHNLAKEFLIKYGVDRNRITVLNNAIKISKKYNFKKIKEIEKIYSLKGKNVVLYIGRIVKTKKLELLLDSMKILGGKYICLIVGDGPHLSRLKEIYGKENNIKFVGEVIEGKENYFRASDVFVLPGTGGLSLNEALYHGLPIVSSFADGSAKDLVLNNKNGFLIKNVTSEKIAEKISRIFERNNKVKFSKKSLELGKKYSFDNFLKNFKKGIDEALKI